MNSTLGPYIPERKLRFVREWRQPVAWPWFTGCFRLPRVTNHNIMALWIQRRAQFQRMEKREKRKRGSHMQNDTPHLQKLLRLVQQQDISPFTKEISSGQSYWGDMGLQSVCMCVNHNCKNRITHLRQLVGNMPGSMHIVFNSECATLWLEGFCNKSKLLLRGDSPSVVWVASDASLKCCKVQKEKGFSEKICLDGSNHSQIRKNMSCHQLQLKDLTLT